MHPNGVICRFFEQEPYSRLGLVGTNPSAGSGSGRAIAVPKNSDFHGYLGEKDCDPCKTSQSCDPTILNEIAISVRREDRDAATKNNSVHKPQQITPSGYGAAPNSPSSRAGSRALTPASKNHQSRGIHGPLDDPGTGTCGDPGNPRSAGLGILPHP
jgi:hypothetical protein